MKIRLLGPVELQASGQLVSLGPPRRRAVFAALAVDAGRPVAVSELVDRIWGERPPAEARNALYSYVARIRRVLAESVRDRGIAPRLVGGTGWYRLEVDEADVDLHHFRLLTTDAQQAQQETRQAELLSEALQLWRGTPMADLSGMWVEGVRVGCYERRLNAMVGWARVEASMGNHDRVIALLLDVSGEHPLAEPLTAVLMRSLYGAGRTAEALRYYAEIRQRLADELGVEPGPKLQELHRAILRGDPTDSNPALIVKPKPLEYTIPAQLPADLPDFTGRGEELARLDAIVSTAGEQPTSAVSVAITGTAGVGKTMLALRWAHRAAPHFPDGQLYVDLHGTEAPTEPAVVIRGFLEGLGLPPQRIPTGLDERAALYRSLLAGRRMLVVLDNARDAEQVRPLLPGASGCMAVVTSRQELTGLVATEAAHPLALDLLSPAESRVLLTRRIGVDRVAAEPGVVDEIITRCAGLPLALAIVCARAATRTTVSLARLAAELGEVHGLDAFDTGDAVTNLRAMYGWSYRRLRKPVARAFRLLGLHPGPEVSIPAAASLIAASEHQVQAWFVELARAHLITERPAGRYVLHNLLHTYAAELGYTLDIESDRHDAVHRLLDHYLHTAHTADRLLAPDRVPLTLPVAAPGAVVERIPDRRQAMLWFRKELPILVRVVRMAAEHRMNEHAWQLPWTLATFLDCDGLRHDDVAIQQEALDAVRRLGAPARQFPGPPARRRARPAR